MTDNNQEEHSFEELFRKLKSAMVNNNGKIFIDRTVENKYLDENLEIKPEYYKDVEKIVENAYKKEATEEDKEKLEEHMKKTELNAFRYRFAGKDKNGNTEKYEYIFLKDKMIVNIKNSDGKITKGPIEFEYKNYSYILFYDIIKGLSEDGENSIFFKKNCYNSSIANIILRYYDKNDEFIDNQGSNFQTAVIEYIQKNNNLTYSNALMKALAEAGINEGEFNGINYCRNNEGKIDDIENIAESAIIGGNGDLIHELERKGVNFATSKILQAICGRDDPAILNYLINNYDGIENIFKNYLLAYLLGNTYHPESIKSIFDLVDNSLKNEEKESFLKYIINGGDLSLEAMQFLFNKILKEIIFNEDKEKIKNFVEQNCYDMLFSAVLKENKEMIKFLLEQPNIDINAGKDWIRMLLNHAIGEENTEIVKLLLKQPNIDIIDINARKYWIRMPLHSAIEKGNTEIAKLLLKQPFTDINAKDNSGKVPLHYAIESRNIEIINLLLKQPNIDINAKDRSDRTPLYYAIESRNIEIINLLLKQPNIDINAKDCYGETPLYYAIESGNIEIRRRIMIANYIIKDDPESIQSLLENNSINISDIEKEIIINYAIGKDKSIVLESLLKRDDIDIPNKEEEKIINYAIKTENTNIITSYVNKKILDIKEKTENIEEKEKKVENFKSTLNDIKKNIKKNKKKSEELDKAINEAEKYLNSIKKQKDL